MSDNPYETPKFSSSPLLQSNTHPHQSPYGPMRDLSSLAIFAKVMLALNIVMAVIVMIFLIPSYYQDATANRLAGVDYSSEASGQLMAIDSATTIISILTIIAVCMWTSKAMANTWANNQVRPSITPGWAAGWYFIPFANLWKPYEAMSEIWSGAFGLGRSKLLLVIWWLTWLAPIVLVLLNFSLYKETGTIELISEALTVLAAILLIRIIEIITKDHQKKISAIIENV